MKLPDYTALGAPAIPGPNQRVATYGNADAVGASQMQFGQQAQEAGSKMQDLVNVANVNDAMANDFQPKANELAANFYTLQGKAALDAAPQFTEAMQKAMNDSADKLSGQARAMFLRNAQPLVDNHSYKAALHAGEQGKVYAEQSNAAAVKLHVADYANTLIDDPNTAEDSQRLAFAQTAGYLRSVGIDPLSDIGKEKIRELQDTFDKAQAGAVQHRFLSLPPDQQVATARTWVAPSAKPGAMPAVVKDVASAILGQESGNNPNAPTSVDGAVGTEQIMPDTFALYAKQGESIVNNADRRAVFNRMMTDYTQRYQGDPARIAVAYFSGPGNVAPADSPTPWIRDVKDGNGKSVSSYVSDINTRLGGAGAGEQGQTPSVTSSPTFMGQPVPPEVASKLVEAARINKEHADKLQSMKDDQQFQQVQNDFFTKQHANQLTWQEVQESNLPVQGPGGKEWWVDRLNKTEKTDPAVFNDLMQRTMLPDGAPGKLTDPKELLGYVGKGITFADMGHIKESMEGGDIGKDLLKNFYKQGMDQFDHSTITDIDGEGRRRAYNWYMATSKIIADAQAKGTPIQQLIDPASKNYVGNNIQQFQEDFVTQTNNMAEKMRINAPAAPLPTEKQRKASESIADYNKRLGIGAHL